jgi:hypothetical protein
VEVEGRARVDVAAEVERRVGELGQERVGGGEVADAALGRAVQDQARSALGPGRDQEDDGLGKVGLRVGKVRR